jgi:hypothetical protein
MKECLSRVARLLAVLCCIAFAPSALAVASAKVTATGAKAGETVVRLFDSTGAPVASDPGNPNSFSNLAPGSYSALTEVGGKVVGARQTIQLSDGSNDMRADSETGEIKVLPVLGRLQQQQILWSFAILGGYKRTPFDFDFRTAAGGASGSGDLEESGSSLALEVRHRLRNLEALGAGLFLYGTYVEYFGTDLQRLVLNLHPGGGNDSGARAEEKRSFMFGLGGRWNLAQRLGAELMVGAHATRMVVAALSDESCCGGPANAFQETRTMWGPMVAASLVYPLAVLQARRTLYGIARWTGVRIGDVTASGVSPFTNWDYSATVRGGWQHNWQFGIGAEF